MTGFLPVTRRLSSYYIRYIFSLVDFQRQCPSPSSHPVRYGDALLAARSCCACSSTPVPAGDVVRWCRHGGHHPCDLRVGGRVLRRGTPRALQPAHEPAPARRSGDSTDETLAQGTLRERISQESVARQHRFRCMIQEKYEEPTTVRTRPSRKRCGSSEVFGTRSRHAADEAASLFCVCNTCHKRWVMR